MLAPANGQRAGGPAPPLGRAPRSRGAGVAGERDRGRRRGSVGPGGRGQLPGTGGCGQLLGTPCPPRSFPRLASPLFAVSPGFFLKNSGGEGGGDIWGWRAVNAGGGEGGTDGRSSSGAWRATPKSSRVTPKF